MKPLVTAIVLALLLGGVIFAEQPVVKTTYGPVSGVFFTSKRGVQTQLFFGIPYASPPIDDLRFRRPEKPSSWSDLRSAEEFAPQCLQGLPDLMGLFPKSPKGKSEDCLYLNVFGPKEKASEQVGYPVMVWIHGGAFLCGSTYEYGYKGIVDNLVSKGVVVVTIQYRLGVFGFLSTGDSNAPGNWGIWDQLEALRWVQDNIKEFGGDPGKVTIFGESAGGASTSLLSYVSNDTNLFHQVISQSGAANAFWSTSPASIFGTKQYIKALGCEQGDSARDIDCLRGKSSDDFLAHMDEVNQKQTEAGFLFSFGPTIDNVLYTKPTSDLARTAPKRPTMLGVVAEESVLFLKPPPFMGGLGVNMEINMTLELLEATVGMTITPANFPNSYELARKMAKFYYVDRFGGSTSNNTYLDQQIIKMTSDTMFNVPANRDLMTKVSNGIDVWAYRFNFYGPKHFSPDWPWKYATHMWDLLYLFDLEFLEKLMKIERTAEDVEMSETVSTLWTNFAKYGNPTPTATESIPMWPKYTREDPKVMEIDKHMKLSSSFHDASAALWTDLLPTVEKLMFAKNQPPSRPKYRKSEL